MYLYIHSSCNVYTEAIIRRTTYNVYIHVLMRGEKEGRKKQARLNKQQGKVTQHTQGSHFSYENELPREGLEPTLDRALYMYTCNTSTDARKDTCVIEQSQLGLFNNTGVLPRSGTQWYTVVHSGGLQ